MTSLCLATSQEKKQWKLKQSVIGSNVSELLEVSVKQLFPNCEADPLVGQRAIAGTALTVRVNVWWSEASTKCAGGQRVR